MQTAEERENRRPNENGQSIADIFLLCSALFKLVIIQKGIVCRLCSSKNLGNDALDTISNFEEFKVFENCSASRRVSTEDCHVMTAFQVGKTIVRKVKNKI